MSAIAQAGAGPTFTTRRLFTFICMVFGMFMAILDIQIVSASLSEIQAGLRCRQRRDLLGADLLSDRRSDHDPAVGLPVADDLDALDVHHRGRRLHLRLDDVRLLLLDQRDDPVARRAGLHRRRHDPHRVRLGLHHLPAREDGAGDADHRPRRHAGADHRPDGRRLPHRAVLLALAVPGQHHPRHLRHGDQLLPDRLRRAGLQPVQGVRLVGPRRHGRLPRQPRIRAGGRPQQGLAGRRAHRHPHRRHGDRRHRVLLPGADPRQSDRRSQGLRQPQLRLRQRLLLLPRHRPLWPHLSLPGLSRPHPRLLGLADRRDHVRLRRRHACSPRRSPAACPPSSTRAS